MTASLLPNIPMPEALNQIVHADQAFYTLSARDPESKARPPTYHLAVPGQTTARRAKAKDPKDNEKSIKVGAGPISLKSNSCRHRLSMKPLWLQLVRPGRRTRVRAFPTGPVMAPHADVAGSRPLTPSGRASC